MATHLFYLPCTAAELASYQPSSGFHIVFRSLFV